MPRTSATKKSTITIHLCYNRFIKTKDFEAILYKQDDAQQPFAVGTFHKHSLAEADLPNCQIGSKFTFEIYRERGNVKWSLEFVKDSGDGSSNYAESE